jgi:tetratricopeptide (TPR) repeat protein
MRALEIDDSLAEAHASLGMITMRYDWDLPRAQESFYRAIELNPGYGIAYQWLGESWAAMGNPAESIPFVRRAQEFDPLSLTINGVLAGMMYFARQYQQAIEQCDKTSELDKDFWLALMFQGTSYLAIGETSKAIRVLERGVQTCGRHPLMISSLANAYAAARMQSRAEQLLDTLLSSSQSYVPAFCTALIQIALGDCDKAFQAIDKAIEERSGWLIFMRVDARFDPIRDDPRFDGVLERMGLSTQIPASS